MTFVITWTALLAVQVPLLTDGRPLNLAPSDLVMAFAALLLLPTLRMRPGVWSIWLFALPIAMALSVMAVGSLSRYSLFNKLIGVIVLLTGHLVITSVVRSWHDVATAIRAFVIGVGGVNLVALTLFVLRVENPVLGCGGCVRYQAFMPDPNLGASLLALAILAFAVARGRPLEILPTRGRWFLLGTLTLGLVLTLSRSGWLVLISGLAAVMIVQGFRRSFKTAAAIGLVAASFALAVFAFGTDGDVLAETAARTGTIESRLDLTILGVDAYLESPLVGIGLGVFPERYGQIIHTSGLWLLTELGIVGLIMFIGLVLWVAGRLRTAYRLSPSDRRPIVSFLIAANVGMFVFALLVEALYQRHWWLMISLSVVCAQLAVDDTTESTSPALST